VWVPLLVESGTRLLNLTDLDAVRLVGRDTAAGLCRYSPGVGVVLLDVGPRVGTVTGFGGLPTVEPGLTLPADVLASLDSLHGDPRTDRVEKLDRLVGRRRWRRVSIDVTTPWTLLVGGRRPVTDDIADSFHVLATQQSQAEARCRFVSTLDHQARSDSLTELANRRELIARLTTHIAASSTGRDVGLIIVDLDDFKLVNDTYGHLAGDELLVAVANQLRDLADDCDLAARLGADEFALMIIGVDAATAAPRVARELHDRLDRKARLSVASVAPRASIGVAVGEPHIRPTT
jgi:diguanylate cyclase (GGDEF)-like protein